jgi:hypothetical protein
MRWKNMLACSEERHVSTVWNGITLSDSDAIFQVLVSMPGGPTWTSSFQFILNIMDESFTLMDIWSNIIAAMAIPGLGLEHYDANHSTTGSKSIRIHPKVAYSMCGKTLPWENGGCWED